jgi:hypothetical protein
MCRLEGMMPLCYVEGILGTPQVLIHPSRAPTRSFTSSWESNVTFLDLNNSQRSVRLIGIQANGDQYLCHWPAEYEFRMNGTRLAAVSIATGSSILDITPLLLKGTNLVSAVAHVYIPPSAQINNTYFVFAAVVQVETQQQIIQRLLRTRVLPYDLSLLTMRASLELARRPGGFWKGTRTLDVGSMVRTQADALTEEPDIEVTHVPFPLRDPACMMPIKIPVRGDACNHTQCLDLEATLQMNSGSNPRWRCPLCKQSIRPYLLWVDPYVVHILRKLATNTAHRETGKEVEDALFSRTDPAAWSRDTANGLPRWLEDDLKLSPEGCEVSTSVAQAGVEISPDCSWVSLRFRDSNTTETAAVASENTSGQRDLQHTASATVAVLDSEDDDDDDDLDAPIPRRMHGVDFQAAPPPAGGSSLVIEIDDSSEDERATATQARPSLGALAATQPTASAAAPAAYAHLPRLVPGAPAQLPQPVAGAAVQLPHTATGASTAAPLPHIATGASAAVQLPLTATGASAELPRPVAQGPPGTMTPSLADGSVQNQTGITEGCIRCGAVAGFRCSYCRIAAYCSVYCQHLHWATHRMGCTRGSGGTTANRTGAYPASGARRPFPQAASDDPSKRARH